MQAKITAFVCKNQKLWRESWCNDKQTTKEMEGGEIPNNPEEYMEAIKRPYRWMDGLLLASSAIAQKVNIVVWQKKRGKRNKIAVLRCGDHWKLLALLNDAELPGEHVGEGCPASIQFDTQ